MVGARNRNRTSCVVLVRVCSIRYRMPSQDLLAVDFPARIQIVEVQDRVEHHEVGPNRLTAPHRVVGEQYDVTALERYIHDHRALRDVPPPFNSPDTSKSRCYHRSAGSRAAADRAG